MLKQTDLTPEEQAEAFRRADEMFHRESEQAQAARSAAQAAEELGVPQEYLDRAAAQIHAERVEKILARRKRTQVLVAVGAGFVAAMLLGLLMTSSKPRLIQPALAPAAVTSLVPSMGATTLGQARIVSSAPSTTVVQIGPLDGNSPANVSLSLPSQISGQRVLRFDIDSQGITNYRVDLRNGDVRWNQSANAALASGAQTVEIPLSDLRAQQRQGREWVRTSDPGVQGAREIVFKFGREINAPGAAGTVTIRNVELR